MLAYLFVVLAVLTRFLNLSQHIYHFTPLAASLLFFGAKQPRRRMWIPLLLMAGADIALSMFVYHYAFTLDLFLSFAFYAAMLWLGGSLLKNNASPSRLLGASLTASISFFFISNFGVWAFWPTYPKTMSGLAACYAAGVPFFRHTLESDLLFTAVFFGIAALAGKLSEQHAERNAAA